MARGGSSHQGICGELELDDCDTHFVHVVTDEDKAEGVSWHGSWESSDIASHLVDYGLVENDGPINEMFDDLMVPIRNGDFSDITLPEDIWRKHLQYSIPQVLVKNWDLQDWEGISCVISRMHLRFLVESMYESIGRLPIDVQQKKVGSFTPLEAHGWCHVSPQNGQGCLRSSQYSHDQNVLKAWKLIYVNLLPNS